MLSDHDIFAAFCRRAESGPREVTHNNVCNVEDVAQSARRKTGAVL